ncbi:MAG: hypothetical protein Q9209_007070 [Squamulea sp. 1 TL-2023]
MLDPEEITYPMDSLIKLPKVQQWIYDNMFNRENVSIYPPYAFRVLKKLLFILEAAIEDPEEDEILDDLANCFASMLTKTTRDGLESIQKKRPVTYTAPIAHSDAPAVTVLEAPNLLSSNGDTGNRTWDAALFLATFLFGDGRHFVQNKSILELGAGLGFVSVLCGKHLKARHVLITDASEPVLCTAQQNIEINGVDDIVKTAVLKWGSPDLGRVLESEGKAVSYDLVLGSDMASHASLRMTEIWQRGGVVPGTFPFTLLPNSEAQASILKGLLCLGDRGILCDQVPPSSRALEYHRLTSQVVPELFNIVDGRALWRIARTPDHTTEAIAAAISFIQPDRWVLIAVGFQGELVMRSADVLTEMEMFEIAANRLPRTFAKLGKAGPEMCGQPMSTARPSPGPSMIDLYAMERNRIGQPPLPKTHHYIGQPSLHRDQSSVSQTPRPLILDQRRLDMYLRPGPSRQPRAVRQRPIIPMEHTSHISVSSSNSTDSTDAESESGSQSSSGSGSESEAPRKSTKGKSTKGKSRGKSGVKSKRKSQRDQRRSSESGSDNDTPRRPTKSVKDKLKGKTKPTARNSTQGRGRSDDEEEPSLRNRRRPAAEKDGRDPESEDEGRGRARGKAPKLFGQRPGRSPSGNRTPKPSNKKAGKTPGGRSGGKSRGRSPSDDEAPPHVDPIEQARLEALKAQNGYGKGKS